MKVSDKTHSKLRQAVSSDHTIMANVVPRDWSLVRNLLQCIKNERSIHYPRSIYVDSSIEWYRPTVLCRMHFSTPLSSFQGENGRYNSLDSLKTQPCLLHSGGAWNALPASLLWPAFAAATPTATIGPNGKRVQTTSPVITVLWSSP